jgi:hypothetical protein
MNVLSTADPGAPIICTLPPTEFRDRLRALEAIVGDDLEGVSREPDRIRVRIGRGNRPDLERQLTAWATEEKTCCAFLGFAIVPDLDAVTIEIQAPAGAEATLDGIDWIVRAARAKTTAAVDA